MSASSKEPEAPRPSDETTPAWCLLVVVAASMLGIGLVCDQALRLSSTYDEVTYLDVGASWWRTGAQESISKMGSPLTFWKIQQAPTLWILDRMGLGSWIDDPHRFQEKLLPAIRIGGSWIWLISLLLTAAWARNVHGPRSMAMAAALFALSPNLLAHGALSTMEMPLVAGSSAMLFSFWWFLQTGKSRDFCVCATIGGLAMSLKFTTILIPPILAMIWTIDLVLNQRGEPGSSRIARGFSVIRKVGLGMVAFVAIMVVSNLVVTGFATIPLSERHGDHPILKGQLPARFEKWAGGMFESSFPQDWVGFATQVLHQRHGGASYLLGQRRMTGWRHYYLVAMAVKIPLAFWVLVLGLPIMKCRKLTASRDWFLPVFLIAFLLAAMLGSKRNYGFRYLLPMSVPAIVWVSSLAEGGRWSRILAGVGLAGMGLAVASIHPHELSYFNELAGGPIGGRKILADSNLDWGQGAKALARLQRTKPQYRDLTLYYFGNIDPSNFGVEGLRYLFDANIQPESLPANLTVETPFLAVSASLQWGPWGPDGYFRDLDAIAPVDFTDDTTIAIYRTEDLRKALKTSRGPG